MKHGQTIRTLNELITVSCDGDKGFRNFAQQARNDRLRSLLAERARVCAQSAVELRSLVRELGGVPCADGSAMGALYRGWVDVRAAVSRHDDETIIAECENVEDYTLVVYRNALDDHLPDFVRRIVLRQFECLMNNYGRVRMIGSETSSHGRAVFAAEASETGT